MVVVGMVVVIVVVVVAAAGNRCVVFAALTNPVVALLSSLLNVHLPHLVDTNDPPTPSQQQS